MTEQFDESSQSNDTNDIENEPQIYEDSIRIRLKYLNDNCRLVQGRLQETIGVFKRYYKNRELNAILQSYCVLLFILYYVIFILGDILLMS